MCSSHELSEVGVPSDDREKGVSMHTSGHAPLARRAPNMSDSRPLLPLVRSWNLPDRYVYLP